MSTNSSNIGLINMDGFISTNSDPIDNLYIALIQCFGIILCGYIAGRFNVITKIEANGLNTFVGTFALPSLIFTSLAKLDFTLVNWRFLLAILLAKCCVFFTVLVVSLLIKKPSNSGRAALFAIFTTQSNDFAIGYPMIGAIYQKTHPEYAAYLYLMAPISLAILNPIGFILLEISKRSLEENKSCWSMVYSVIKGVALNPVLFMTILGIIGNVIFSHVIPPFLAAILEVLGNAFSASALFLLGLMMVGKVHKLKGTALVIPGILISVKLLVLPLIIRESIILLNAGANVTDTRDLSTYGFLYGTIPTAPALFIFTLRYNVEIDLIASAMVACVTPASYVHQLRAFSFDISTISVVACIWLLICFLGVGRKYKSVTHRYTLCLVIAQLITAIGTIIWTKLEANSTGSILWYIQFILISLGVYGSRIWTVAIAVTLLFLNSHSLPFVQNMQKWLLFSGCGVTALVVSLMCICIMPKKPIEFELQNPNFQLGRSQAAISVAILLFCFIVTLGCLILQQRYHQIRNDLTTYSSTNSEGERSNVSNDTNGRNIVDVEDIVSHSESTPIIGCEFQNICPNSMCTANRNNTYPFDCNQEENITQIDSEDPQILRHLVFLILLSCSMFIGLSISISTLIMDQMIGIYAELAFLDIALNFGQSLIAFTIFGLDPGLNKLGSWLQQLSRKWRGETEILLPQEDALSSETIAIREQFNRCHLAECRARIAICRRRLLKVYRGVFTGCDLVDWLLEAGIVQTREDAVHYGRCLLESRILQHVDGTCHFDDKNLLYTFSA
ncbi:hypothetical protein M0802_008961 [Mischocyttarus mexicanus]|nr:hypothetical protein M0802_008961 [Mischocyttarus mexicanus]